MESHLTKGAIEAILKGEKPGNPQVQILKMMRESSPRNTNNYYYKLVLSDGQTSYPNFVLPVIYENFAIGTGGDYSIIRLKKYNIKPSVGPLPDVYLSDVDLILDGWSIRKKIGNPVPYHQDKSQVKKADPKKELENVSESKTTSKEVEVSTTNIKVKKIPLEESKKDNVMTDESKDTSKVEKKKAKEETNTKNENTKKVNGPKDDKSRKEVTNKKDDKITKEVTNKKDDKSTKEVTNKKDDKSTKEVTNKKDDKNTKEVTNKKDDKSTEEVSNAKDDKSTKEVTNKKDDKITKEVTNNKEDKITKEVTNKKDDKSSKEVTNKKDDKSTNKVTNKKDDKSTKEVTNKKDDKSTKEVTNNKEDKSTKEVTNKKDDKSTKEVTNRKDDKSTKEVTNKKDDKSTKEVTNKKDDKITKEVTNNKEDKSTKETKTIIEQRNAKLEKSTQVEKKETKTIIEERKAKLEKSTQVEKKETKTIIEQRKAKLEKSTQVEKKETKTDANNNKCSSDTIPCQKIEDYVCDIVRTIQFGDISDVEDITDSLSRMRYHRNISHQINYVKVIQCLGEIGIEELIQAIRQTAFICCDAHRQKQLYPYVDLLYILMNSVNVIKRVVYHRATLIPLFFKTLKPRDSSDSDSDTYYRVIQILSLFLTVGPRQITETYYRKGLLPLLTDLDDESPVTDIYEIVQFMVQYGDRNVRQAIKKSHVLYELETLDWGFDLEVLEIKDIIRSGKWPCLSKENTVTAKERLKSRLDFNSVKQYCSSPKCRKDITSNTIKYCGACKLSRYCNVECQKYHWTVGHRHRCLKLEYIIDFYNQKQ